MRDERDEMIEEFSKLQNNVIHRIEEFRVFLDTNAHRHKRCYTICESDDEQLDEILLKCLNGMKIREQFAMLIRPYWVRHSNIRRHYQCAHWRWYRPNRNPKRDPYLATFPSNVPMHKSKYVERPNALAHHQSPRKSEQ